MLNLLHVLGFGFGFSTNINWKIPRRVSNVISPELPPRLQLEKLRSPAEFEPEPTWEEGTTVRHVILWEANGIWPDRPVLCS